MRQIREGEVPKDGGTAIQDDPNRPVFRGNGPADRAAATQIYRMKVATQVRNATGDMT